MGKKSKRLKRIYLIALILTLVLVITFYAFAHTKIWGCHGDMFGEEHCHKLCMAGDQGHCAYFTELFGGYSPGHIH